MAYASCMQGFDAAELKILRSLNTPKKIQDFLDAMPMNFDDDSCKSPRGVLRERTAMCMEGAMFAAAALRRIGHPPLVMDLKAVPKDVDHVVAVYQLHGCWGAISKTNHGVLRYREPIYRTIRELALSYFHEYFLDNGSKTMRSYSRPIDLSRFDDEEWMTTDRNLWDIAGYVDSVRHYPLLSLAQIRNLRKADPIERQMGKLKQWSPVSGK